MQNVNEILPTCKADASSRWRNETSHLEKRWAGRNLEVVSFCADAKENKRKYKFDNNLL